MNVYMFQSSLLCRDCGEQTRAAITAEGNAPADIADEYSFDSDTFPKGPYSNGGGEADSPQHCDHCGLFLENELTPDGDSYVRDLAEEYSYPDKDGDTASWTEIADRARKDGQAILAQWIETYFAWG